MKMHIPSSQIVYQKFLIDYNKYFYLSMKPHLVTVKSLMQNPMTHTVNQTEPCIESSLKQARTLEGDRQCRICLEGQNDSSMELISPCRCTGSVRWVHVYCLQTWIRKTSKLQQGMEYIETGQRFVDCEICKKQIQYEAKARIVCYSWDEFTNKVRRKMALFILLVLMTLIISSLTFFLIWFFVTRKISFSSDQILQSNTILCSGGLILGFFITTIYFFTDEYIVHQQLIIQIEKATRPSFGRTTISAIHPYPMVESLQLSGNF